MQNKNKRKCSRNFAINSTFSPYREKPFIKQAIFRIIFEKEGKKIPRRKYTKHRIAKCKA
jgi:hypothetical protein